MTRVRRVSVESAMKVGAVMSAVVFAIVGVPIMLLYGGIFALASSSLQTAAASNPELGIEFSTLPDIGGLGIVGVCVGYICGIGIYAVMGAIMGAIYALVYNLVSRWTGGLEVELVDSEMDKLKGQPPYPANNY